MMTRLPNLFSWLGLPRTKLTEEPLEQKTQGKSDHSAELDVSVSAFTSTDTTPKSALCARPCSSTDLQFGNY